MNKNNLKAELVRNGFTTDDVAKAIGISRTSLDRKMNGTSEFKLSEVFALVKLLHLDNDAAVGIFLR